MTVLIRSTKFAITILLAFGLVMAKSNAAIIYVSTGGSDLWSGGMSLPNVMRTDGPLRTVAAAQVLARSKLAAMNSGAIREPVRVIIAPGIYVQSQPLALTEADSGTPLAPMSYEAATPRSVIISGGITLKQRSAPTTTQPAVYDVPSSASADWTGGGQLFVNNRLATLARQPNAGQYYFIQKATLLATEPTNDQGRQAFVPTPSALTWINGLAASDRSRAIVNIMHAWTSSQHHFGSNAPGGSVSVTPSANWRFLNAGVSQRYYVENVSSALDAPGEWYGDATGLRYLPAAEEVGKPLVVVMPLLDKLVTIKGNMNQQRWAQHITFKGLAFAYTRYLTPSSGYVDAQAATDVAAAIEVENAKNISIDDCTVAHVAGYGVWFRRDVRDSSITKSRILNMGAGGIKLGQTYLVASDPIQTGHNVATGNLIGNTGKLFPGAVGIWVGQSSDNTVANNMIYNTTYTGISVGWTWGYGPSASRNNRIADNLLANIGQGMMSDMAGIYTVGISPGTSLSGNVIREVRGYPSYGAGAWGIYQDSGSSDTVVSKNIVVGASNGTYQLTTGRRNTVQDNLFALGDRTELNLSTSDPVNTPLTVVNNLLVPKVLQPFAGYTSSPNTLFDDNRVTNKFATATLDTTKCGSGCTLDTALSLSTTPDPRSVSVSGVDFGTTSLIAQTAARAGPLHLSNLSSVTTVATALPPVALAPPINFSLDIANAPLASQPIGFWYSQPGTSAATTTVANSTAPNGRCLQYTDSSSNVNGYDPHTYAPMSHTAGTTTGEFYLLIDSKTNFAHQWRDNGVPALTGPALTVTSAGVNVGGAIVAPITLGKWTKFRITTRLGNPNGTWSLQVTDALGQTSFASNLPYKFPLWRSLNWWGFISNAATSSSFCLHTVTATNVL